MVLWRFEMTVLYDKVLFAKFRALAITEVSQLIPGTMYYSNYHEPFVFLRTLTEKEFHSLPGSPFNCLLKDTDDNVKPKWIMTVDGRTESLRDSNIGASYNPWLIFDDEGLAEACERKLKITYERDPWDYDDRDYHDYDHHYAYDDE